jgi:hypothetical protein
MTDAPVLLPAGLARLTAAPGTTAVASRSHWLRLANGETSSPEFVSVELGNRATCAVSVVHLDKRESSRLACGAVTNDADSGDRSSTLEERLKIGLGGLVRQIADVQFGTHELPLHLEDAIGLMAGSSGMLHDDTQERREARIYCERPKCAAVRRHSQCNTLAYRNLSRAPQRRRIRTQRCRRGGR